MVCEMQMSGGKCDSHPYKDKFRDYFRNFGKIPWISSTEILDCWNCPWFFWNCWRNCWRNFKTLLIFSEIQYFRIFRVFFCFFFFCFFRFFLLFFCFFFQNFWKIITNFTLFQDLWANLQIRHTDILIFLKYPPSQKQKNAFLRIL